MNDPHKITDADLEKIRLLVFHSGHLAEIGRRGWVGDVCREEQEEMVLHLASDVRDIIKRLTIRSKLP